MSDQLIVFLCFVRSTSTEVRYPWCQGLTKWIWMCVFFFSFCVPWNNLNRFVVVCSLKVYWIHLWEAQALCGPFWWGAMGTSWVVLLSSRAWDKDSCERLFEGVLAEERKQGSRMGQRGGFQQRCGHSWSLSLSLIPALLEPRRPSIQTTMSLRHWLLTTSFSSSYSSREWDMGRKITSLER